MTKAEKIKNEELEIAGIKPPSRAHQIKWAEQDYADRYSRRYTPEPPDHDPVPVPSQK